MVPHAVAAWLFTLLLEVPIVAGLYAQQRRRMAVTAAMATSVTNLAMNVLLPHWATSEFSFLVIGETAALGIEAVTYFGVDRRHSMGAALLASAVANTASFTLGLLAAPILFH